ncbi:MAG: HEPN domain-containing protein [Phycisphaerae bacterium]|nr:HEPN domain-containing protein [Phycisphaerae bacterium]
MNEKIVKNWLDLAQYDFDTAEIMLDRGRHIYVAFMCQQTIEKVLKAIYVKNTNQAPPYTHNLTRLLDKLSLAEQLDDAQCSALETLNSYYIECRYTEAFEELSSMLDQAKSKELFNMTKELFKWFKSKV